MQRLVTVIAVICCVFGVLQAGPAQAKRLALAVGIDVYDNLPASEQLKKAVNDARAMAAALRDLGFAAEVEENLPKLAFTRAWQKFLNRLEPGDTAALFFAGHGVVVGGVNYLLPRDVPKVELSEDKVLAGASIRFNDLMDDLREKKVRVSLFIVDACRDNPFRDGRGRFVGVGGTRGLAVVEPAKGAFVMYSAGAGERALDRLSESDKEANSPYTRALLPILRTPGLSMPEIAVRVRRQVVDLARTAQPPHEQRPAYYDDLDGDFVLKAGLATDAKPAQRPQPLSEAAKKAKADEEAAKAIEEDAIAREKVERARARAAKAQEEAEKARKLAGEAEEARAKAESDRRKAEDRLAKAKPVDENEPRRPPASTAPRVEERYRVVRKLSGGFLAVRIAPNPGARLATTLTAGATGVTKLQCIDNGWCRIARQGSELGWVNASYLEVESAPWQEPRQTDSICQRLEKESQGRFQVVDVEPHDTLKIRREPRVRHDNILAGIPPHATDVEVGACAQGWCIVRHNGVCGFASPRFLSHADTGRAPDR